MDAVTLKYDAHVTMQFEKKIYIYIVRKFYNL